MKSVLYRQFLVCLISFTLVFNVQHIAPTKSYANQEDATDQSTDTDSREKNLDDELKNLRESLVEGSSKVANLDPFLLTKQIVVDDRSENVEAAIQKVVEENYKDKFEYLKMEIASARELLAKTESRLEQAADASDVSSDLLKIKEDLLSRIALYELELEDFKKFDPRDPNFDVNNFDIEHMVDQDLKTRHYWGNKLKIAVHSREGRVLEFSQKEFTESLSPHFSKENPLGYLDANEDHIFEILNPKGEVLHRFETSVEAVMFYGNYLVFTEKASLDGGKKTLPVRFIDLNHFRSNIGNAPLPVFTLPLKVGKKPNSYGIENGYLMVDDKPLSIAQFEILSRTHRMIFNTAVAMVDPSTYDKNADLVENIIEFFGKSMAEQDALFQKNMEKSLRADSYLKKVMNDLEASKPVNSAQAREVLTKALKDGSVSSEEFKEIESVLKPKELLGTANTANFAGRKFFTRLRLFMNGLIRPRPEGAPKLRNAILIAANYDKTDRDRAFDARGKMSKIRKFGMAAVGAVAASAVLPESHALHISQTLDLVSASYQHFQGYLEHIGYGKHYADLSKDAFLTSTSGIFRLEFIDAYFTDGKWSTFFIGLGRLLLIPVQLFGAIHVVINSVKILYHVKLTQRFKDRGFIDSFLTWATKDNKAYWMRRAKAEKDSSGSDLSEIKDQEVSLLRDHLNRLKSGTEGLSSVERDLKRVGKESSAIKSFFETVKGFKSKLRFSRKINSKVEEVSEKTVVKDKDTVWKALAHGFLSYSSLSTTFGFNARFWNKLFFARSFYYKPSMWLMAVMYPSFAKVAGGEFGGKQHYPTVYNGGLDSWPQKLNKAASKVRLLRRHLKRKDTYAESNVFLSRDALRNLDRFEDAVGKLELLAMEISSQSAQKALLNYIKDPERILVIFDSSQAEGQVTTGINSLHDKKLNRLSKKERTFYRSYYSKTFDLVMQRFLSDLMLAGDSHVKMPPEKFAREFVKNVKAGNIDDFKYSDEELKTVKDSLFEKINAQQIWDHAKATAENMGSVVDRLAVNFKHNLLKTIHPGNPQIMRQHVARMQLKKPRAMDRAVRMEITSLFSSIPIGIMFSLALYAGVDTGLLKPFDPNGLDTETHRAYMNRFLFYNGFVPGLILGLMANTWMKLQMDFFMDQDGGFDKAIMHKDTKKGFWRFYLKNFFKNPANKWKKNQLFSLKLVWANIPAAILTTAAFNAYGLGRFDVDSFVLGYLMVFATVMHGFGMKVENAFERSTSWVYSRIPRKLRAHPDAQKYLEGRVQRKKFAFAWYENIWAIAVEENIFGTMLTMKDNVLYGTRSFGRFIIGGGTPTTALTDFADKLTEAFKAIPGVEKTLDIFKTLISHNYEAFERYPDRLVEMAPNADRLYENPNLPDNALAEFIGKAGGAVLTVGGVAAMPYLGAYILDVISEKRVQITGRIYKGERRIKELSRELKNHQAGAALSCKAILN